MAHVCHKANSDVCHTAVIVDAACGNLQQPAHNLIAIYTEPFFCPTFHHQNTDATAHDVTATCNHAYLGTQSMLSRPPTVVLVKVTSWMPVIEYCNLYLSYSALSTAKLQNLSYENATYTYRRDREF